MSDNTQNEPVMHGSDDATDDEKAAGRAEQDRADAAFYEQKDAAGPDDSAGDPTPSAYSNPSSAALDHRADDEA